MLVIINRKFVMLYVKSFREFIAYFISDMKFIAKYEDFELFYVNPIRTFLNKIIFLLKKEE